MSRSDRVVDQRTRQKKRGVNLKLTIKGFALESAKADAA